MAELNVEFIKFRTFVEGLAAAASAASTTLYVVDGGISKKVTVDANGGIPSVEWGTFSPTVLFSGADTGVTYGATREGVYTRIGNVYLYALNVLLTSKGSASGALQVGGLPAPPSANGFTAALRLTNVTWSDLPAASAGPSNPIIGLRTIVNGGADTAMTQASVTNDSQIRISGFYFV